MNDWIDFLRRSKTTLILIGAATAAVGLLMLAAELWSVTHPVAPAGDPATHARIRAMTDCGELQEAFDTAGDNFDRARKGTPQSAWSLAYMDTADDRMEEIGCYG